MSVEPVWSRTLALRTYAVALGIVGYAGVGTTLEPHTWPAAFAVLIPAGVVAAASLFRNRPGSPTSGADVARNRERAELLSSHRAGTDSLRVRRSVWLWSVVITVGLLWEAWAFFHQPAWDIPNHDYPTLSVLVTPALEDDAVRFATWTAWLYAGFRLV